MTSTVNVEAATLKRCPFCNHVAAHEAHVRGPYVITCLVCTARVTDPDRDKAIAAWNQRAALTPAAEPVGEKPSTHTEGGDEAWSMTPSGTTTIGTSDDLILVKRGVLGAACYILRKSPHADSATAKAMYEAALIAPATPDLSEQARAMLAAEYDAMAEWYGNLPGHSGDGGWGDLARQTRSRDSVKHDQRFVIRAITRAITRAWQRSSVDRQKLRDIINARVCGFVNEYSADREEMIDAILALIGQEGGAR